MDIIIEVNKQIYVITRLFGDKVSIPLRNSKRNIQIW